MESVTKYIINIDTASLIPHYNELGELWTIVIEKNGYLLVEMSPHAVIDFNLRYYGSSMRSAKDGVKAIIGNVNVPPVTVNEVQGIYWLSSKPILAPGCVWFSLHFIVDCLCDHKGGANVYLTNGHMIQVDVCRKKMDKQINQTYLLKSKKEERTKQMLNQQKALSKLVIKKQFEQLNFEIASEESKPLN